MNPLALPDHHRAELFQGLGRALSAGLNAAQALDALAGICDGALDRPLALAANAVRKGTAASVALDRQGLVGEADYALLSVAEDTGTLDRVCLRLAERYSRAHVRWRQLKGRLMLPAAVLVIGILVLPLPAVAGGRLSVGGYVLRAGAMLALVAMIAKLAAMTVRHWRAHGTPGWLTYVARRMPGVARMSVLHQRADLCERLALSLTCGMPAGDALAALRGAERNGVRRAVLVEAHAALGGGTGVADALQRAALLDPSGYAIVSAGEGAGRLEESLARFAGACHDALDDGYELLARWLPVGVYLLVAGFVAAGILG